MIDRTLLERCTSREGLLDLLEALDWPIDRDYPFEPAEEIADNVRIRLNRVPQIAADVTFGSHVRVSSLVQAGVDDERLIILAEFQQPYVRRDLRELLRSLRQHIRETARFSGYSGLEDTVFIVAAPGYEQIRFVLFDLKVEGQPKLRSFEWTRETIGRTLLEFNLERLKWADRRKWEEAWDVEKLTREFFHEISDLFFDACDGLSDIFPDENNRRLYVQTLFNRILFLRFVERKGWLRFNDRPDYLRAVWEAGQCEPYLFWPTRLSALFRSVNRPKDDPVHDSSRQLIGEVEYLNGGLFEDDPKLAGLEPTIPKRIFRELLGPDGLLYRYNFTVEESSPLDVQVAVDPEILGKIFEQLTTSSKRHDTGSYYTPREVVQFMCREALVGFIASIGIQRPKAHKLIYKHEKTGLMDSEGDRIWNALLHIKVVDPACGSGAYLLGMLQELHELLNLFNRIDSRIGTDASKAEHDRKLWIIENNIYGVDIQAFATNTAMLRLWLTLLVEDKGTTPQPLPNLEYKIEIGDALMGPNPSKTLDWSQTQDRLDLENVHETVQNLRVLRSRYQDAHGPAKLESKRAFEGGLADLREKVTGYRDKDPSVFDWRVEFFDVFLGDPESRTPGFSIVLANPPYLSGKTLLQMKGRSYKNLLSKHFSTAKANYDIYVVFWERGIQLLATGGMVSFIVPNKILVADYAYALRTMLGSYCVVAFADLSRLPVFLNTGVYPIVLTIRATDRDDNPVHTICSPRSVEDFATSSYALVGQEEGFPSGGSVWSPCESIKLHARKTTRLADIATVHGGIAGFQAQALTAALSSTSTPESIPFVVSGNVDPYEISLVNVRYMGRSYHRAYVSQVESCISAGKWALFMTPKIVIAGMTKRLEACWCPDPIGVGVALYSVTNSRVHNLFLLAVLNSSYASRWYTGRYKGKELAGGYLAINKSQLEEIPIPEATDADCAAIVSLVQQILERRSGSRKVDTQDLEDEIDARVRFLYEGAEAAVNYDEWVRQREAEKGTTAEEVRKLIADDENARVEFKETLDYADRVDPKVPEDRRAQKIAESRKVRVEAVLKTICAFYNTKGGTLLIGVSDRKEVIGLEPDFSLLGQKKDRDGFENKLTDLLKTRLRPIPSDLDIDFPELDGKVICRIVVPMSLTPHYLDNRLFVRLGNSTEELLGRDLEDWLAKRRSS